MAATNNAQQPTVLTHRMSDGYEVHYRLWGPAAGEDVIILFHAGMSHSGWQAPLAEALTSFSDISFVAPDRRGCGLNQADRGDLASADQVIDDVIQHVMLQKQSFSRVHLAGWCAGAQETSLAAARTKEQDLVSTLILLTPGFFWTERLSSLIDFLTTAVLSIMSEFNIQPDMRRAFAPLPIQPSDFTSVQRWHDFIEKDPLRTTKVSLNFGAVSRQMQEMSLEAILNVEVPVFFALAERDRIVDNEKVQHHINQALAPSPRNRLTFFDAEHAIHFTKADELAKEIQSFVVACR